MYLRRIRHIMKNKRTFLFTLILTSLFISGCAHRFAPKQADETTKVNDQVLKKVQNISAIELPAEFTAKQTLINQSELTQSISQSIAALTGQFQVTSGQNVELANLIQSGLTNNPNLAVTASRVNDALLGAQITQSSRLPNIALGANGQRSKSLFINNQSFLNNNFNLGINAQWEADIWGRLKNQTKADYQEFFAAQLDYQYAELSLAANIARAYFNLLTEKEILELRRQSNLNTQRIENITERSFKSGLVSALDVQLARRDLAGTKQRKLSQDNNLTLSSRNLSTLLGEYPKRNEYVNQLLNSELPQNVTPIDAGLPVTMVTKRPDLQASLARIQAAEFDNKAARRALLPTLSLTASGGTSSSELKNLLDGDFSVWSLLSNVSYPILNRKRLTNSVKLSDNNLARQIDAFDAALLNALQEVENSLDTEQSLIEQVQALQEARDYAEQSARRAQTQYESGLTNANTLLATQNQFFAAEESLLRTRNALLQNRIRLYLALGGNLQDTQTLKPIQ